MGLYGPFTAVAGTMQKCQLSGDADAIYVRNTSIYDLAISFRASQPVQVANFGGGDWYTIVPAGDRVGIRVPDGIYGGSGFPGWVWVVPMTSTGSMPVPGVIAGTSSFWIETYEDANYLPPDYASPQFQNLASQPRVVTMEPTGIQTFANVWDQTAGGGALDLFPPMWANNLIPPGFTQGAGQPTDFILAVYCDYLYLLAENAGSATRRCQLQFVTKTGGGAVVDTVVIAQGDVSNGTVTAGNVAIPWQMQRRRGKTIKPSASAVTGSFRLALIAGAALNSVSYDISADIDWWNQQLIPYVGGGEAGRVDMQTQYNPGTGLLTPQLY